MNTSRGWLVRHIWTRPRLFVATAAAAATSLLLPPGLGPHLVTRLLVGWNVGTSGQTADVAFVSKSMRRIGTVHCILAYLFNTTVLALLINIGASLF